ncbi:response regulator [Paenibacillaceae bacterium]|nr:response regulator [Paenibacillaceae bacterium]
MDKNSQPMIKLCVIDDIRSVVNMISSVPPWHEHGIEVAGTALDGEAGIRLIKEQRPNIVLTDIRMPKLDGLAMTKEILELDPETKIIILSAYTDFSYTQQAIRLGAFDFVKKPFSIEEIMGTVLKAKEAYLAGKDEKAMVRGLENERIQSLPMLQQEYMSLLIYHPANEAKVVEQWQQLEINLETRPLNVFVVEVDQFMNKYKSRPAREIELMRFSLRNILKETVSSYTKSIVFRESANRFVCIMNCADNKSAEHISEACRKNIQQFTHSTISIGVGPCVDNIADLPDSYQKAVEAVSYHFYTDGNGVSSYTRISHAGSAVIFPAYNPETEGEFLFALRSGNKGKCQLILEKIFNGMLQSDPLPEPQRIEDLCYELSAKICRSMLGLFPQNRVQQLESRWLGSRPKGSSSFNKLREMVQGLCDEACSWIGQERIDESTRLIYEARDYISANLNVNLSLEHCAKQSNLSPGYFSNLFKKVLGISFQQYVTHQRMERAKTMLIEGFQVQEIAQDLGYEHRRYFSDVFKKHTNMTPSEFKIYSTGKADTPLDLKQDKV